MSVALNVYGWNGGSAAPSILGEEKKKLDSARSAAAMLSGMSVVMEGLAPQRHAQAGTPPASKMSVTLQEAADALSRLLDQLEGPSDKGASGNVQIQLRQLGSVSMDTMLLATSLMSTKALGNTAEAKAKALSIMSDRQEALRSQEVKDAREQADKAVEQADKALKAGIIGVAFDWIIAAAEVVSGVMKIVGGAMTGNAMTVAGGAMDLMAGFSGIVKATMNTMALIDEKNAEKYRSIADVAGKVQLAFEIAGAAIDITSAVRNMLVAKAIPKAATAVMEEGGKQVLSTAIKTGTEEAVKRVSQEIAQGVVKKFGQDGLQKMMQQAGSQLQVFSEKAIKEVLEKSVKKVADEAIKSGVEMTAKELTKAVTKQVNRDIMKAVVEASLRTALGITRAVVGGASGVTSGVLALDRAKLQRQIDQLILDQQWLQMCFDFYDKNKEAEVKKMKDLISETGKTFEGGSNLLRQGGTIQVQVAASMV